MITDDLLDMLRCPDSRQPLQRADADLVAKVNRRIAAGRVRNRTGQALARQVDGLLVRADDRLAYAVIDDIPILLIEEAIDMDGISNYSNPKSLNPEP